MSNIPQFDIQKASFKSTVSWEREELWLKYVNEHFLSNSTNKQNFEAALAYNISQLEPNQSHAATEAWDYFIKVSEKHLNSETNQYREQFKGQLTRLLFEKSDKSDKVQRLIHNDLYKPEYLFEFLCADLSNTDIFKTFTHLTEYNVIRSLDSHVEPQVQFDEKEKYLWSYVLSDDFVTRVEASFRRNDQHTSVYKSFQHSYLFDVAAIVPKLDSILGTPDADDSSKLKMIESIFKMTSLISKNVHFDKDSSDLIDNAINATNEAFERHLPEHFKQYQLLESLGVTPEFENLSSNKKNNDHGQPQIIDGLQM